MTTTRESSKEKYIQKQHEEQETPTRRGGALARGGARGRLTLRAASIVAVCARASTRLCCASRILLIFAPRAAHSLEIPL